MASKKTDVCYIICTKKGGFALAAEGGSHENGAIICLHTIDGSAEQQWVAVPSGAYVRLVNKASGKVLDTVLGGADNGCLVHQWDHADVDSQLWSLDSAKTGRYKIISKLSGKCLDIAGMAVVENARVQIWDDLNGENQKWLLAEEGAPKTERAPAKKAEKAPAKKTTVKPVKAATKTEKVATDKKTEGITSAALAKKIPAPKKKN